MRESEQGRRAQPSIELLQTLVVLIEESGGDAGRAAARIGINQPSMSKRLSFFQHAGPMLARPWLERQGKKWELTEEGRRHWVAVTDLVRRHEVLVGCLKGDDGSPPALRFACGRETAAGLACVALGLFRKRHPDVALRISTLRGAARIEGVATGVLDLATVSHDEAAILEVARRPLHTEHLLTGNWTLLSAPKAPWHGAFDRLPRQKAPLKALVEFPLILPEPDAGVRRILDATLRACGLLEPVTKRIVLEAGGWETISAYAKQGFGVGVVARAGEAPSGGLQARALDPEACPPVVTRLICRRLPGGAELDLTPHARAWRDALLEARERVCPRL